MYIDYIVVGYVFVKIYYWGALRKPLDNIEHVIIQAGVIGYIYFMIWQLLPISINKYIETVMIMFFAGVTAYIAGKIISSPYIVNVLEKLHICDTGNYYIWQDFIDKEHSVKATITYEKKDI